MICFSEIDALDLLQQKEENNEPYVNEIHSYVHTVAEVILTVTYFFNHMDHGAMYETDHLFRVHICKHNCTNRESYTFDWVTSAVRLE